MTTQYSHVSVMETATSVGLADATGYLLDYRYFDANYPVTFAGTQTSVGTGDFVKVYVSPDANKDGSGMYVQVESFTTTAFTGVIQGPWGGIKFVKGGTGGTAKVVAMMNGYTKTNNQFTTPN